MIATNYRSVFKRWGGYATAVFVRFKGLAPYALIEIILPGGSVIALLLWLYRRHTSAMGPNGLRGSLASVLRSAA
jgi:hypothetical protein